MNKSLVSIIVPIYNVEKHLTQCLESIVNQSYTDIEIICINDGSPDKSIDILNSYQKKDKRIVVVSLEKNAGVSNARNVGLSIAKGDYICFIDSDDWVEKEHISNLLSLFDDETSIASVGFKWGKREKNIIKKTKKNKIVTFYQHEALKNCISDKFFWCVLWNKMFKREIIKDFRFDVSLHLMEDVLFLLNIVKANLQNIKIKCSTEKSYHYVFTPNSLSSLTRDLEKCKRNEKSLSVFEDFIKMFSAKDPKTDGIISVLNSWEYLTLMQFMYSYRAAKSYSDFWRCQKKAKNLYKDYKKNVHYFSGFRKAGSLMLLLMTILTKRIKV